MRKGLTVFTVAVAMSLVAFASTVQHVAGTILDPATGDPVEGLQVSFFDAVNAEQLASAMTDPSGHYDTGNIPAGNYRVRFSAEAPYKPRYLGSNGTDSFCGGTVVAVLASTTTALDAAVPSEKDGDGGGVEIELDPDKPPPTAIVGGTVVDAETGTPLPGIRVTFLHATNATVVATATTGPDGSYSVDLQNAPASVVRVRFTDPSGSHLPEYFGAGSDAFCAAATVNTISAEPVNVSLEQVPPAQLTQQLTETVESYDLSPAVETLLGTSLTQVRKLLADDNPGNDSAACGQLASFATRVDVQERRGELSAAQASELKSMATNVRGVLGCQ